MFTDQHQGAMIKESQAPQVSNQEFQSPGTMKVSPGGRSEASKVFPVLLSSNAFIDSSWKTVAIPHKSLRQLVGFPPSRFVTMAYLHVERRVFLLFLRPKSEEFLDNFPSFPPSRAIINNQFGVLSPLQFDETQVVLVWYMHRVLLLFVPPKREMCLFVTRFRLSHTKLKLWMSTTKHTTAHTHVPLDFTHRSINTFFLILLWSTPRKFLFHCLFSQSGIREFKKEKMAAQAQLRDQVLALQVAPAARDEQLRPLEDSNEQLNEEVLSLQVCCSSLLWATCVVQSPRDFHFLILLTPLSLAHQKCSREIQAFTHSVLPTPA